MMLSSIYLFSLVFLEIVVRVFLEALVHRQLYLLFDPLFHLEKLKNVDMWPIY